MNMSKAAALVLPLFFGVGAQAATIDVYTDRAAWAAASSGGVIITEDFSDAILNCTLSAQSTEGFVDTSTGKWYDVVDNAPLKTTDFNWSVPVFAAGGIWNLAVPGGPGTGLTLTVVIHSGGTQFVYEIPNTTNEGFVGFTSDEPIDSLQVRAGTQAGGQETYTLDNLQYAELGSVYLAHSDCGVTNSLVAGDPRNCTLQDKVKFKARECEANVENHGDFVSCFTQAMNVLKKNGIITGAQKGALTSCAARTDIGKPQND